MTSAAGVHGRPDLGALVACPICDLLHEDREPPLGGRLRCARCGAVMRASRARAAQRMLAAALASAILMFAAVAFPFIGLSGGGFVRQASIMDAVGVFAHGWFAPLTVGLFALIVAIPAFRAAAMAYALGPSLRGRPPAPGAARAFRLAMRLKPWSMMEIFLIGAAVALVKISDLAEVSLGPAFWALAALVAMTVLEDAMMCRWSVWRMLSR